MNYASSFRPHVGFSGGGPCPVHRNEARTSYPLRRPGGLEGGVVHFTLTKDPPRGCQPNELRPEGACLIPPRSAQFVSLAV